MNKPVKLILDTDLGGDCDDAGMMALMHRRVCILTVT